MFRSKDVELLLISIIILCFNNSFPILETGPILIFVTTYKSKKHNASEKKEFGPRTNKNNNDTLNSNLNWEPAHHQVINPSVEGLFTFSDWVKSEYNNRQGSVHT